MRISTYQFSQNSISAITDQQFKLNKTQMQLSTGRRLLTPADDPGASSQVLNLGQSLEVTKQYQENAGAARAKLYQEETVLGGVVETLQRFRELSIQANNSTQSNESRKSIASELRQLYDHVYNLVNTRDSNDEFLFSGYQGHVQPFQYDASGNVIYQGDQGQRQVQTGLTRYVPIGDNGSDTFVNIPNGNATFTTREDPLNTGTGVIDPGVVIDASAYDGDTYTIVFPAQTSASPTLTFNDAAPTNDTLGYTLRINGTAVYSVTEAGTPVNTLTGLASVINDDTPVTGVRAYVNAGQLYLVNDSPSSNAIVITEEISGYSAGEGDGLTGYFGSVLNGDTAPAASLTSPSGAASQYLVLDSAGTIEAAGPYVEQGLISFKGIQTYFKGTPNRGDSFTLSPSSKQSVFTTLKAVINAVEANIADPNDTARLNNAINRGLTDIDRFEDNIVTIQARIGARLNAVDHQADINDNFILQMQDTMSTLQDLDYAEATSRLNLQLLGLQASQQAYQRIQGISLFNYLK